MSEQVVKETIKKEIVRRGIGTARGTSRLKFSHEIAKPNGLFIAHLESVEVKTITIGEEKTGMPSFNGLEIPRLVLTFASNEDEATKRHYVTLQFMPVESNAETIPGGKDEWKFNVVFDWLKHLINVFVAKNRELTEDEINALSVSYTDFNESGDYIPVDPKTVVDSWRSVFENFENMFNRGNNDKEVYKTSDNKFVPLWIKLIRCIKTKKGWINTNNGDLAFPSIVSEGCIEIFKPNALPSIRVDAVKESILPKVVENKPKAPTNLGMPVMGGIAISDIPTGLDTNNITYDAAEDMPF